MRISTNVMNSIATGSIANSQQAYSNILQKLSSGKNFIKMSESPLEATKVLKFNDKISKLNNYQDNIQHAINEMDLAYQTLDNVSDELSNINALIVQAADATTTPGAAKAIAVEIKERVNTISAQMNTKYLDDYIFAGTYVSQKPYDTNANGEIEYLGSSQEAGDRNVTISENTVFTYNFTGEEIFGKQDGVNDFFAQMRDLDTLLTADELDYDKIREKLFVLDDSCDKINQSRGIISSNVSKLESTFTINESAIIDTTADKAEIEEIDIAKIASDLASAQTSMQASYLMGTNILGSVSLLDYL